jgi:hypothetical protein
MADAFGSLDELIKSKAVEYAARIKSAAAMADKEEEIRIESEKQLAFIQKDAGITLEGKHEYTVASGRVDSVYSRVIIEYKNPKSAADRIGPKADSPGSKKVVEQIKSRFYDMQHQHAQPLNSLFGVGLDGNHFIFIRFRDENWQVQEPVEVNRHSAERFLWALFNLGSKGKPFSPEYLARDFGSEGNKTVASKGIHALYDAIIATDNPKAQTFFSQWKILFGEVCGYEVDNPTDKLTKLATFYDVSAKNLQPAALLFSVHTYYALFMKLLAAEIVAFFHKLPTPLEKMMASTTSNKLKREMEDLEAGSIFRHLNITNFLEGDLFAWYTSVWTPPIEELVREMVMRLDDYNPGTLAEDPAGSRDLLKELYRQLFPKSVRHDLGEYYTPDWLAEHVLDELGYIGDPDKRLLDPAVGSGTFLIMAINRIRSWYAENREQRNFDEGDLGRKILSNVIGFDLNPLAVMAARTNYLIAIRDLIGRVEKVEIPIYLCDSVLTPSEYGGLFAGNLGNVKKIKTAPATFLIPTEIATNAEDVAKYTEQLEFCIRNRYSPDEFLQRCRDEALPLTTPDLHIELYRQIAKLDRENKNGVWARIIKNAFAPLYIERVDFVAGNPPWINWNNLPAYYRDQLIELNQEIYDLFPHHGVKARHGSASIDIATLFVYVGADKYLLPKGKLGFVITQSVFKSSGGSEGFRRFALPDGTPLRVFHVDDYSHLQPFEGAQNRTAVLCIEKGRPTEYPLDYFQYELRANSTPAYGEKLPSLKCSRLSGWPVQLQNRQSPWITVPSEYSSSIRKVLGASPFEAKLGVHTWLNGAYWLLHDTQKSQSLRFVVNAHDVGRKVVPRVEAAVEADIVYPLLRGRDVRRWTGHASLSIIVPHDPERPGVGIPERELKRTHRRAFEYFQRLRPELEGRSGYRKFIKPAGGPFYAVYNIGTYTFRPYRVVWREQASTLQACVISTASDGRLIIPDHKLTILGFDSKTEAHFVCALLNCTPVQLAVKAYSIEIQISTHIAEFIALPRFDEKKQVHREISRIGQACHEAARDKDGTSLKKLEVELDGRCAEIWGLTIRELTTMQEAIKDSVDADLEDDWDDPE